MRSTDWKLTKQTMGRIVPRTSTKQRSITLVVGSDGQSERDGLEGRRY